MPAVGIALAAFLCWGVVGYALTSLFLARRQAISNLLLAPAIGMGTLELAAHGGLRLEMPVKETAYAIVLGSLLAASVILLIRRPPLPLRRYLPFALILIAAFGFTGWPLLRWGGDWVANANDDMAHYCIGAAGYCDHGFLSFPVKEYLAGQDLTFSLWSLYADCIGHRHGSEMSMAMATATTGFPTPFIFMPMTLAMHLVLISSVGYLLCRLAGGRTAALIACGFMAISPLSTYGVVQQLIAQVGGLGLLAVATGYYLQPARRLPAAAVAKRVGLGGLIAASVMLHYIEAVPFLFAAFGLHVVIGFARGRRDFKQLAIALLSASLVPVLLGWFVVANVGYLVGQSKVGNAPNPTLTALFPQYLGSEGFARLCGFATIYDQVTVRVDSPWPMHRLVIAGGLLVLLSLTAAIALAWHRRPVGEMLLVVAGVAVMLFRGPVAFGLFKLAMYAQPFILGSIAQGWVRMSSGWLKWAALAGMIALVPLQVSTQRKYVSRSTNAPCAGGSTPFATQERLFAKYWQAFQTPGAKRYLVPTGDRVSWMLLACCCRGKTLFVPHALPELEGAFFGHAGEVALGLPPRLVPEEGWVEYRRIKKSAGMIDLLDPSAPLSRSDLGWDTPDWLDHPAPGDYLVEPPALYELFNRYHRAAATHNCSVIPLADARNFAFWRKTSLSRSYTFHPEEPAGLWDLQADVAFPQDTMAAAGRYVTIQVLNPSSTIRLLVAGTTTYLPGEQRSPSAAVVGDRRLALPMTGYGASRVVSEPLRVQTVGDRKFVVLDLGPPVLPNKPTHPLYWDPRPICMNLRDVSILSEADYAAMSPPADVRNFPDGLAQKQLEFSGCGEDGSLGRESWFRLTQPQGATHVTVRGRIPRKILENPPTNHLTLKWKGIEIARKDLKTDEFEVRAPVPSGDGSGRLEIEFTETCMPPGVPRPVSAQLTFIGFEP